MMRSCSSSGDVLLLRAGWDTMIVFCDDLHTVPGPDFEAGSLLLNFDAVGLHHDCCLGRRSMRCYGVPYGAKLFVGR